jgi:hypothetical protein
MEEQLKPKRLPSEALNDIFVNRKKITDGEINVVEFTPNFLDAVSDIENGGALDIPSITKYLEVPLLMCLHACRTKATLGDIDITQRVDAVKRIQDLLKTAKKMGLDQQQNPSGEYIRSILNLHPLPIHRQWSLEDQAFREKTKVDIGQEEPRSVEELEQERLKWEESQPRSHNPYDRGMNRSPHLRDDFGRPISFKEEDGLLIPTKSHNIQLASETAEKNLDEQWNKLAVDVRNYYLIRDLSDKDQDQLVFEPFKELLLGGEYTIEEIYTKFELAPQSVKDFLYNFMIRGAEYASFRRLYLGLDRQKQGERVTPPRYEILPGVKILEAEPISVSAEQVKVGQKIGSGVMAFVYKAEVKDALSGLSDTDLVIKVPKTTDEYYHDISSTYQPKSPDERRGDQEMLIRRAKEEAFTLDLIRQKQYQLFPDSQSHVANSEFVSIEGKIGLLMESVGNDQALYSLKRQELLTAEMVKNALLQYFEVISTIHELGHGIRDKKFEDLRYNPDTNRLVVLDWNVLSEGKQDVFLGDIRHSLGFFVKESSIFHTFGLENRKVLLDIYDQVCSRDTLPGSITSIEVLDRLKSVLK